MYLKESENFQIGCGYEFIERIYKTKEIVSKFNDDRLHYICHKENIGFWNNFKFAVAHCKADYFVAFHDDDIMMKDCLRLEKNIMDHHPEAALVCGIYRHKRKSNRTIFQKKKYNRTI